MAYLSDEYNSSTQGRTKWGKEWRKRGAGWVLVRVLIVVRFLGSGTDGGGTVVVTSSSIGNEPCL
jgi:hypothetical protein